jgi:hypothetical protein
MLLSFSATENEHLLFGFSTNIMSEKYSFECVKFYTSWFFLRQVAENKQTISKLEKQQTKERKQNTKIYQT